MKSGFSYSFAQDYHVLALYLWISIIDGMMFFEDHLVHIACRIHCAIFRYIDCAIAF